MTQWERATYAFMVAGAIFYAGWIASAAHFNVAARLENEKRLVYVQTQVVPKLQTQLRQLGCDNDQLVEKAIYAIATGEDMDWDDLNGCKRVPVVKPPPVEKILKK
ncbi:MAG: hypothetical protein E6R03_07990 [Hyphomicrobiaceae bacterium]|nr:MAG: hypothetical protein E6R03_07990 [Hyphomicrobiaceae bacterium]